MDTDKEYYDKYIAPFYSSPFGAVSSGGAKKAVTAMALAGAILVVGIVAAVFFIAQDSTQDNKVVQEKSTSVEKDSDFDYKTNYEKGLYFYERENYKSAKKYFKRVGESDSEYKKAQKYLEKIKMIERKNNMEDDGNAKQRKLDKPN